jgi:hypothetical protein
MKINCFTNLCLIYKKNENWEKLKEFSLKGLEFKKDNPKCWYYLLVYIQMTKDKFLFKNYLND